MVISERGIYRGCHYKASQPVRISIETRPRRSASLRIPSIADKAMSDTVSKDAVSMRRSSGIWMVDVDSNVEFLCIKHR
jgi:hypothetical protein